MKTIYKIQFFGRIPGSRKSQWRDDWTEQTLAAAKFRLEARRGLFPNLGWRLVKEVTSSKITVL